MTLCGAVAATLINMVKLMYRIILIFWGLVLVGCGQSGASSKEFITVNFKSTAINLPKEYLLPGLPPSITGDGGSLDDGEGVSLKIPLSEIGYQTVSSKGLIGNTIASLSSRTSSDDLINEDVRNAWQGIGLYEGRIVEYDSIAGLYRVYSKAGHPKLWNYFKGEPSAVELNKNDWVASCMVSPLEEESSDLSNVTCKTIMFYKEVQLELSYSGLHIVSQNSLLETLRTQLTTWDVSKK